MCCFDPYYLRHVQGAWYVVGFDHLTGRWPVFKLARIRSLIISKDTCKPQEFSATHYFKGSLGIMVGDPAPVKIKLIGYAAMTADEQIWPEGFSYQSTGRCEGILSGRISDIADLFAWVASFQGDAEMM